MQNILTRSAMAVVFVGLAALLGLSTLLNGGHSLLVGSTERTPAETVATGSSIDGAIPSRGQPGLVSEKPRAGLMINARLSDPSIDVVLAVLEQTETSATFFVVGIDIPGNEQVLRRIADAGHDIGLGSFNQSRIGELSEDNQIDQYRLSQRYVEGATGTSPTLIILPYTGRADSLSGADADAARNLQAEGFVPVFPDEVLNDDNEVADLGARNLILAIGEQRNTGIVKSILTSEELAAYQVGTVADFGGVGSSTEVGFVRQTQGRTLLWVTGFQSYLQNWLAVVSLIVGVALVLKYLLATLLVAGRTRTAQPNPGFERTVVPGVSVLIPARNADRHIKQTLLSIRQSKYQGPVEILVIDHGSTDRTGSIARLIPGVRVLTQAYSGKATAANEGVRNATHDICVLTTADAQFGPQTLSRLVAPLSKPTVALVTGQAVNRGDSRLSRMVAVEQVSRSLINQGTEIELGLGVETSPAITALRRSAIVDVGGIGSSTSAENVDLTVALGVRGWCLEYEPAARVTVAEESTLKALRDKLVDQRYGLLQVIWKYRKASPGANNIRYRFPALSNRFLVGFIVPLLVPLVDVFVLVSVLKGERYLLASIWLAAIGLQFVATWVALAGSKARVSTLLFWTPHVLLFRYLNFVAAAYALFRVVDRSNIRPEKVTLDPREMRYGIRQPVGIGGSVRRDEVTV